MAKMPIWLKRTEIWNKNFYACSSVRPVVQKQNLFNHFENELKLTTMIIQFNSGKKWNCSAISPNQTEISQLHMQLSYVSFPNKKENGKNRFLALQGVINK